MFDISKSIKAFNIIANGGRAELSKAQIVNLMLNFMQAKRNLDRDTYYKVSDLYDAYRTDKTKVMMDYQDYTNVYIEISLDFSLIAPFELYANPEYSPARFSDIPIDLEEKANVVEDSEETYDDINDEAEDEDYYDTKEPINVLNDHYYEESGEDTGAIDSDEQPFEDEDYLEYLYDLSVEESNKAVYKYVPGDIQGALHFAIFKVLSDFFSNSGTPWLCDYLSECGLTDSQIQDFLRGYESMFMAEEMGAYDIEWDLRETDDLDLTLMYKAVATISYSAPSMDVAERLQQYLSPEELEYLITDYDPDDPVEAAIYDLFMFYDMQLIDHGETTDENDDYSPEDTEPLDDKNESNKINEESVVKASRQEQQDETEIIHEKQSRYNITEILKAGEYSDTDYQKVFFCLRQSDKYKDKIEEFFTGVYVTGDMDEILSELETIMNEKEAEEVASQKGSDYDDIPVEALRALKLLYDDGILTDQEFSEKKRKLLNL